MASKTKRTERIRKSKKSAQGSERKRVLKSKGSTRSEAELFGDEQN